MTREFLGLPAVAIAMLLAVSGCAAGATVPDTSAVAGPSTSPTPTAVAESADSIPKPDPRAVEARYLIGDYEAIWGKSTPDSDLVFDVNTSGNVVTVITAEEPPSEFRSEVEEIADTAGAELEWASSGGVGKKRFQSILDTFITQNVEEYPEVAEWGELVGNGLTVALAVADPSLEPERYETLRSALEQALAPSALTVEITKPHGVTNTAPAPPVGHPAEGEWVTDEYPDFHFTLKPRGAGTGVLECNRIGFSWSAPNQADLEFGGIFRTMAGCFEYPSQLGQFRYGVLNGDVLTLLDESRTTIIEMHRDA